MSLTITTSQDSTSSITKLLIQELTQIFPKTDSNITIKIIEQHNKPFAIRITGDLPMIEFKIIEYKSMEQLRNKAEIGSIYPPELVVNNFNSQIGQLVVDWLMVLFPFKDTGNRTVSFVNCNDYIFMRLNRYRFRNLEEMDMQDVGPHLTLRLRRYECDGEIKNIKYGREKLNIL